MESKYDYQFTQKAEADLDDIVAYITLELSNPKAASDFVDKLQKAIEEICMFPKGGFPVINELFPDTKIRKKQIDNYMMYYLPNPEEKNKFHLADSL